MNMSYIFDREVRARRRAIREQVRYNRNIRKLKSKENECLRNFEMHKLKALQFQEKGDVAQATTAAKMATLYRSAYLATQNSIVECETRHVQRLIMIQNNERMKIFTDTMKGILKDMNIIKGQELTMEAEELKQQAESLANKMETMAFATDVTANQPVVDPVGLASLKEFMAEAAASTPVTVPVPEPVVVEQPADFNMQQHEEWMLKQRKLLAELS